MESEVVASVEKAPGKTGSRFAGANKELWLVFSLFAIAALLNSVVDAHRMVLGFYTLPTLFSAYAYGRRHAVMTALSSVLLVVLLAQFNPTLFSYRIALPDFIERWFDLGVWAGILLVTAYAMGTLYERNRRNLEELRESYHGILMILQQFAANDKYSQDHAYRVAVCATRIAECMSLDADRIEDVRAAALLHNVDQLGISMDVLCKAAQMTQGEAEDKKREKAMGGSLRRVIPIVLAHQRLGKGQESDKLSAPLEARILEVADAYETLTGGQCGEKLSPDQAEEAIIRGSGSEYDSRVVDAFIKAFQRRVMKKGAGV